MAWCWAAGRATTNTAFSAGCGASAQLISYELPLGLGILGIVVVTGSLRLDNDHRSPGPDRRVERVDAAAGLCRLLRGRFAEAARLPFDLPEAEQELVGGYHTEYSGIKLMMYMVAEFLHMVLAAFLIVILFLGGWHFWGLTGSGDAIGLAVALLRVIVLAGQSDGRNLVLHARPLELAAVPLRSIDGHRLESDDPLGMVNLVVVAVCMEYGERGSAAHADRSSMAVAAGDVLAGRLADRAPLAVPTAMRSTAPRRSGRQPPRNAQVLPMKSDDKKIALGEKPRLGLAGKVVFAAVCPGDDHDAPASVAPQEDGPIARERHEIPDPLIYRGVHRLNRDEQGRVKCVACFLCATACPAHCIDIVAAESPWPDREKYPAELHHRRVALYLSAGCAKRLARSTPSS